MSGLMWCHRSKRSQVGNPASASGVTIAKIGSVLPRAQKNQTVQNRVKKLFLTRLLGVAAGRKASRMLPLFCYRLTAARQRVFDFAHARVAAHGGRKTQSRRGSVKKLPGKRLPREEVASLEKRHLSGEEVVQQRSSSLIIHLFATHSLSRACALAHCVNLLH